MKRVYFVTGTDTGAGKTVLSSVFTQYLHEHGQRVIAFKPLCSGGRADAQTLHTALAKTVPLDLINPWHFRAPLAPMLAARRERKRITLPMVLAHIKRAGKNYETILVEGAGGLLSPLGENFNSRDLLLGLRARPIVVAQNKLGVVNHILLTLAALPPSLRSRASIVLMSPPKPDLATKTNFDLLRELLPRQPIYPFPWHGKIINPTSALKNLSIRRVFADLAKN